MVDEANEKADFACLGRSPTRCEMRGEGEEEEESAEDQG